MEKLLVEFARHADRDRFALHFVSLAGRGAYAADIEACGWPVHTLDKPEGLRPSASLKLARLLRRHRVDVLHTHNNGPLIYGVPVARLAGVRRLVHTRHEQNLNWTPRHRRLFRLLSRRLDWLACVSADSAALSVENGVSPAKVRTILNGVDLGAFDYGGAKAGGPAVIVARLRPEKDFPTLIRAVAIAVRRDPAFRLEIAGDGPEEGAIRALVAELGLEGHVRFLGLVRDVPSVLRRASQFVLSSTSEGIPVTLLEAMARGLPTVATRVGGIPEVVAEGETGLLVPPSDPAAMAEALLAVAGDPARGEAMGRAGRARVESRFDVRRMVREYEALYTGGPVGRGAAAAVSRGVPEPSSESR
jgi:glycosyltransferase involved in cell wall biosynthesis